MRRTTIVLVATLFAIASCGGDDDDSDGATEQTEDTDDTDDSTSTTAGDDEASDEDPSALTQLFLEGLGFSLPTEEAECVADGLVDALGLDGLAALGRSDEPPSDEDLDDIAATLDGCVSSETVESLLADEFSSSAPSGQEEAVACLASEVSASISMGDLVRIGFLSRSDPNDPDLAEFEDVATAAAETCGISE